MRTIRCAMLAAFLLTVIAVPPAWSADAPQAPATVEGTYRGLSTGALRDAHLITLPQGLVLRAGAIMVTAQQVDAEIAKAKPELSAALKRNRFFLLEQMATKPLLLLEARAWAKETKWAGKPEDERALLTAYFNGLTEKLTVTDEELRQYYAANQEMMGGAAFDTVAKDLRVFVLDEKRQHAIEQHTQSISARITVEVDAAWVAQQANTALDNPVDAARRAGKPAVIDFGAEGCRACDMMTPILTDLQQTYGTQCTILFINVRQEPILAARYGITSIPVQVFFDKDGKEVVRHVGYFPKTQMLEQLAKLGVE